MTHPDLLTDTSIGSAIGSGTDKTSAEVIADSTWDGVRLVTFRATFPRFILAEFNTHRAFSRNSASSRAIPVKRQIELVRESPFVPQQWPMNQAGMSAASVLQEPAAERARANWLYALDETVEMVEYLGVELKVHKQIASRLLEPFMWHTVIVSSTMPGLDNFFAQRDHEDAQPEMQLLARAMRKALDESVPADWHYHIPFTRVVASNQDYTMEQWMVQSVARCARVSYGRELEEKTFEEDMALVTRLINSGHWSPFEHVGIIRDARLITHEGNFEAPWSQLRHHISDYLCSIAASVTTGTSDH